MSSGEKKPEVTLAVTRRLSSTEGAVQTLPRPPALALELPRGLSAELKPEEVEQAKAFLAAGVSENTKRAYRADWEDWQSWCRARGAQALPASPENVAAYLSTIGQQLAPATVERRLAAIAKAHTASGYPTPTRTEIVGRMMAGIRRTRGVRPMQKAAVTLPVLRAMVAGLPFTPPGLRDRALLVVGFAGAFRRSEYVKARVEDLRWHRDRVDLFLPRSKGDQEGEGTVVPLPLNPAEPDLCPGVVLRRWLQTAGITAGYIFRGWTDRRQTVLNPGHLTESVVADVVKKGAARLGLDPATFGAHSLRAGFVTQALGDGAEATAVQRQTRHKDLRTLMGYQREVDPLKGNAAANIWRGPTKEEGKP